MKLFKTKDILTLIVAIPILLAGYVAVTDPDYEQLTETVTEIQQH